MKSSSSSLISLPTLLLASGGARAFLGQDFLQRAETFTKAESSADASGFNDFCLPAWRKKKPKQSSNVNLWYQKPKPCMLICRYVHEDNTMTRNRINPKVLKSHRLSRQAFGLCVQKPSNREKLQVGKRWSYQTAVGFNVMSSERFRIQFVCKPKRLKRHENECIC